METQEQTTLKSARLKTAIIILAALLVLSAGGLVARYVYLQYLAAPRITETVPDNLIGEDSDTAQEETPDTSGQSETPGDSSFKAESVSGQSGEMFSGSSGTISAASSGGTDVSSGSQDADTDAPSAPVLELYQGRPDANQRFEAGNMLPGDTVTRYFCVKVRHDTELELFFRTDVTEQTKVLGDVLHIRVTELGSGSTPCSAPFSEINGREFPETLLQNPEGETVVYYRIDVSLDTSVGNEYQAASLMADLEWYVKDEGGLTAPQTGSYINPVLWTVLAVSALLLIFLLALSRRGKEGRRHG